MGIWRIMTVSVIERRRMSVVSAGSVEDAASRQVPAAVSRRREYVGISTALCVAAVLVVVPALLLRPMRDAGVLGFTLGPAIAFGLEIFVVELPGARGKTRQRRTGRYLTAPTWTGMRTIDLHDLSSIRARLLGGRFGSITYVVVTDSAGVRMSFSGKKDIELIRNAVRGHPKRKNAPAVEVSGLAASLLGLKPLPRSQEALYSLWSIVPLMLAILAIGGVITALAA
jgi:hypothetical protein